MSDDSNHRLGAPDTESGPSPSSSASGPPSSALATATSTPTTAHLPHEERLHKAWRTMGTVVVQMITKAENASKLQQQLQLQPSQQLQQQVKESFKELDEAVVLFLRARMEFHRLLSHVEAKLQGKAEEMESLETYLRTQPKVGKRKRKRSDEEHQQQQPLTTTTTTQSGVAPSSA